jgi:pimeloyl-ACP methyl ester carboxylesterase
MTWQTMIFLSALAALVPLSYLVEAFRRAPAAPDRLDWAPDIPIRYVEVKGTKLRYIAAGRGPALVLLHTLRTQLDMFQRVIPELAKRFRVYALDYPGHGYSDIPAATYSSEFFVTAVAEFLDQLDIRDAVIVGESIGGSIGLLLAARHNPRVRRVVAINPYDYDGGRGIRRSSLLANVLFGLNNVPLLGSTVTRLRLYPIVKRVLEGGVYRKSSLPSTLARELYRVGNRRGHYRALMSLVRHWPSWERGRADYAQVDRPTLLVYGDHDWSRPDERESDRQAIPGAELRIIKDAGHFLSLDAPQDVVQAVVGFANIPRGASRQ